MAHRETFNALIGTMKIAVAALRDANVPFVLGGSAAAWARGGPEPDNDLDLMVPPAHADAALEALAVAGLRPERPPEEWLYKAWHGDVMIDIIFRPTGLEVSDDVLKRADTISIMAISTPVMALEDVLVTMLCALDEHALDYSRLLAITRALREQINWSSLRTRTSTSPFANAFMTLVGELGLAPPHTAAMELARTTPAGREDPHSRVRVRGAAM